MKRRHTDGDRRDGGPDMRPVDELVPHRWRRDDTVPGRRRFDGLSIELLWERVEALTKQSQDHDTGMAELRQLLGRIEAGTAILRDEPGPVSAYSPSRPPGLPGPERALLFRVFHFFTEGAHHIASTDRAQDAARIANAWGAGSVVYFQGYEVAKIDVTGQDATGAVLSGAAAVKLRWEEGK